MITKERAIDALKYEQHLAQLYRLEHQKFHRLIDIALMCRIPAHKDLDQTILEQMAEEIVGPKARYLELRTMGHVVVLSGYLDWLLSSKEQAS